MKTKIILLTLALGASTCLLTAQDENQPQGQPPPPREDGVGNQRGGNGPGESEPLTDAQKSQVKAILAKYDASTLTADQARAIHEAFHQAGIHGGAALNDAVKAAGFDPDKLRDLAPPPGQASGSIRYVGDFYAFDAELSYRRAEVFGKVVASLTSEQKAAFAKMKFGDFNTWPDLDERDALKRPNPTTSRFFTVVYMTYASEFFSWYGGSVEADTYFCPERHGTYFGSFYMKDMPAMNKRNYDISTSVTGDSGENFLNLLTADQRANITSIPDRQKKLLAETVEVRQAMSVELRKFLTGGQADKSKVLALGRRYGALDGEMSWMYATAFAQVGRTLTPEQRAACVKLRNLDGYHSAPGYLYSNPLQKLPTLPNSDFLFVAPPQSAATQNSDSAGSAAIENSFVLRSPAFTNGGSLPVEYTGDGASITPPLEWSSPPAGTKAHAVILHHIDPQGITKWYWTLYNIPANVTSLPKNVKDIGTLGNNSVNGQVGYAPPHSRGPGLKTYILTVYALSAPVQISAPPAEVNRDILLAAMKPIILNSAELKVVYDRTSIIAHQTNEADNDHLNTLPGNL